MKNQKKLLSYLVLHLVSKSYSFGMFCNQIAQIDPFVTFHLIIGYFTFQMISIDSSDKLTTFQKQIVWFAPLESLVQT